jgi:hypothetical protein
VQFFQTNDPIEARTCRRAQFSGYAKELTLNGVAISGLVHSVKEDNALVPTCWTVTIIPQAIVAHKPRRSASAKGLNPSQA